MPLWKPLFFALTLCFKYNPDVEDVMEASWYWLDLLDCYTLQTDVREATAINSRSHPSAQLTAAPPPTSPAHGRLHECLLLGISTVTTVRKYLQLNMIFRTPCCSSAAFRRPSWFLERLLGGSNQHWAPVQCVQLSLAKTRQGRSEASP